MGVMDFMKDYQTRFEGDDDTEAGFLSQKELKIFSRYFDSIPI